MANEPVETIVHALYKYNTESDMGSSAYQIIYFENSISDVRMLGFSELTDLSNIPDLDTEKHTLLDYLHTLLLEIQLLETY